MRWKRKLYLDVVFVIVFMAGILFVRGTGDDVRAGTNDVYKNIEIFAEVLRQIEDNYVEPQKAEELINNAIKGMVQALDPHSSYMTKEEHQELLIETKGSFSGIGIEITIRDNVLTVVSPIEDTPAFEVGLKAGDQIIMINDKPTMDMTLMDAIKHIRGAKGTKVKITVKREGENKPLDFDIVRDVIPLKSVKGYLLKPDIGYVRISNFQGQTTEDLYEVLDGLQDGHQFKGLILDLRNNPGGLLSQAIKVSDVFLDSGIIVSTKGRNSSQDMEVKAQKNETDISCPIIVLVNGGSASASEIVAGALRDNKRALILGTKTFGKGSVQTILPLSDGSGLRLTTARYYTPNGTSIQLSGITPDINVEFVPPPDKDAKEKEAAKKVIREVDLMRHMLPDSDKGEEQAETGEKEMSEAEKKAKMILDNDNQVRQAVQLLQTWNIFSQIRP